MGKKSGNPSFSRAMVKVKKNGAEKEEEAFVVKPTFSRWTRWIPVRIDAISRI